MMEKRTKKWVTYYAPGSFTSDAWTVELFGGPDPADISWPDNAYAFTLHEREDVHDDDRVYQGEAVQVGPTYYHPDSKVETLEQAKTNPAATPILISNMECNRWAAVVWTRWGNWPQPMSETIEVLQ